MSDNRRVLLNLTGEDNMKTLTIGTSSSLTDISNYAGWEFDNIKDFTNKYIVYGVTSIEQDTTYYTSAYDGTYVLQVGFNSSDATVITVVQNCTLDGKSFAQGTKLSPGVIIRYRTYMLLFFRDGKVYYKSGNAYFTIRNAD